MKAFNQRQSLLAGVALIVLTNAVALSGVMLNRIGEAESRLVLSERELALAYGSGGRRDNSGLALRLDWRTASGRDKTSNILHAPYERQPGWLDATRMAALGFDIGSGETTPEARQRYLRQLSQQVLIVFELAGSAWHSALQRAREGAGRQAAAAAANPGSREFADQARVARDFVVQEEVQHSRLFAIDAGTDLAALRKRYPERNRFLILRGTVRPALREHDGAWQFTGQLSGLAIQEINVPLAQRPVLDSLRVTPHPTPNRQTPRYEVQIAVGQRLEPWIERVSPLSAAQSPPATP